MADNVPAQQGRNDAASSPAKWIAAVIVVLVIVSVTLILRRPPPPPPQAVSEQAAVAPTGTPAPSASPASDSAPGPAMSGAIPQAVQNPPPPNGSQILDWRGADRDVHPCLYISPKDVARAKQTRKDLTALAAKTEWGLEPDGMDNLIAAALVAGNAAAEKVVITEAFIRFDELIGQIPNTTDKGTGPHAYARQFGRAVGLADAALAGKLMTADERKKLRAKIAQVGYLLNDPNYWNEKKCGFCPNMTTSAEGYRLTIACLIPSHPQSKAWRDNALKALKAQLDAWTDSNGGMAETPHYSMVIFDQWLGAFLIARNAGMANDGYLFDPEIKKAIQWFGNISTPRDTKNAGFRRWPTVGHTYVNERTCNFGLMANLWKDKDPDFAAQMQWMHLEHGSFADPGVLSYYPAMMGYRSFLMDNPPSPKQPQWTSACYPETGVLLRNTIGSDRETTLYMIGGRNHSHYFNDSGSITLWGKGRELCDEDSYQFQRSKDSRSVHSMPDKPATLNEERVMALREFSTSHDFDYVHGTRRGWQRQIAFVKDSNPLGPNYFVLADTFDAKSVPTTWRLFIANTSMTVNRNIVTVTGKEDVDLDIIFVRPNNVKVDVKPDHIEVPLSTPGTLTAILYPRIKSEKTPRVSPLADGKGVKVVTPAGTDYIFLDPAPIAYTGDGITFNGKAGLFKERGGNKIPSLPGACDVTTEWTGGDRELRGIRWNGPQYPKFADE